MADQSLDGAIQTLRAQEERLSSEVGARERELQDARSALKRVKAALSSLTGVAGPNGSGSGISGDDLVPILRQLLESEPDLDSDDLRSRCRAVARELGKTLRGFRTSYDKALRLVRTASQDEGEVG